MWGSLRARFGEGAERLERRTTNVGDVIFAWCLGKVAKALAKADQLGELSEVDLEELARQAGELGDRIH